MLDSFAFEHVQDNDHLNFKSLHDKDNDTSIYDKTGHTCVYYEPETFFIKLLNLMKWLFHSYH